MQFLLLVVIVSVVGIVLVLMRHRQPTSMESSISHFNAGLQAIAPDAGPDTDVALSSRNRPGDVRERI